MTDRWEIDTDIDQFEARTIRTPDGRDQIVSIPSGHWVSLEYMVRHGYTQISRVAEIAYNSWICDIPGEEHKPTFSQIFCYAIQEAYVQFSNSELGYANDNYLPDDPV